MMTYLLADGVSCTYDTRPVLVDVTLSAPPGHRVGLVGENGSGKTTLLRIAAGITTPDAGTIVRPARTGLLHQEHPFGPQATIAGVLRDATSEVRAAAQNLEAAGANLADGGCADTYADALDAAERLGAWDLDARIAACVAALGLDGIRAERRVVDMSGGQRRRLALAHLLLRRPDAILLDEPTNHLDDAGIDYLTGVLRAWPGPVVFASHDRAFLDDVATHIVDLDPAMAPHRIGQGLPGRQGTQHTGTYTEYLVAKRDARRRWGERYAAEQEHLSQLRAATRLRPEHVFHTTVPKAEGRAAKKFYADRAASTVTRRVRAAAAKLQRAEREQVAKPPTPLVFSSLGAPGGGGNGQLVAVQDVAVSGRLRRCSATLDVGGRLLVAGANGSGKSTLLGVIVGAVQPTCGACVVAPRARVGLLAQDVHWPDPGQTPAQLWAATGARTRLAALGLLAAAHHDRPVGALSLGQQRRVALALLIARPPDVLCLDEPTNHLSLALVDELVDAIGAYPGAVVVASHDRWLRAGWVGDTLVL